MDFFRAMAGFLYCHAPTHHFCSITARFPISSELYEFPSIHGSLMCTIDARLEPLTPPTPALCRLRFAKSHLTTGETV